VVSTIFLGFAKPAAGPVPRYDSQFFNPDLPGYDFDIDKANALLDEAGFPRGADGVRFSLRLLPAPYFIETRQFGAYLRQALAEVGIDAELVNNDSAAHQQAVYTVHAFDLAVGSPVSRGDPAISTTILVESGLPAGVGCSNKGGYAYAELDALLAAGRTTVGEAERVALYREFQRLVVEDLPLINVAEWGFTTVASDQLHNIQNTPRWAVSSWPDTWIEQ
jgi:peptide/nickel transport system substrate-binding protein